MTIDTASTHLPDADFWNQEIDHGLDPIPKKFSTKHFGVLVDAPKEVQLGLRSTLPLIAYYMGTFVQVGTRPFPTDAYLAAMDPERNLLHTAKLITVTGEDQLQPQISPPEELPEGYFTTLEKVDLRVRLRLPWEPGRLITQAIVLDLASNRVETKLAADASKFVDLEKEKFVAAERAKRNPQGPAPELGPKGYTATPDSPAMPEGFGVALSAPRVAVLDGKAAVYLRGTWKLPLYPEELVKADNVDYNKVHGLLREDGATPYAACATMYLLIFASGGAAPLQLTLRVPVEKSAMVEDKPVAMGNFNIDLTKLSGISHSDQTVFVYAYAKDWAAEPVTIGLVDRTPKE